MQALSTIKKRRKFYILDYISVVSLIILVVLFTALNKNFLGLANIRNLLNDIAPLLVMGVGISFVLLAGSFDLSVGAIASTAAVIFALLIQNTGYFTYLIVLIFGILAGVFNGVLCAKVKLPSFISTLGSMRIWMSVALLISNGMPLGISKESVIYFSWAKMRFGIITMPLVISIIVLLIGFAVQQWTSLGKHMYAIGANEKSARIAGVNVDLTKIMVFMLSGLFSALTGIMLAAKLQSGIPTVGDAYTLLVITALALGGISLGGGKGNLLVSILGMLLVVVIKNGMNVIGVDSFWQNVVYGFLIIGAIYITAEKKGKDQIVK